MRDTGIGIPQEKQNLIFDAFSQVDSSIRRRYGGTGLGLTISDRIIKMMNGRLWVESEPGKGSTFHCTAWVGRSNKPVSPPRAVSPVELQGMRVLIVDDNATNRLVLSGIMGRWKAITSVAEGGRIALVQMEAAASMGTPFRIVLIDGQMPEMDGFQLAQEIQRRPQLAGVAVMMLTSANQHKDTMRCRELGVSAYLIKPIRQYDLLRTILKTLGADAGKQELLPLETVPQPAGKPLRILLAEDNEVNQRLASRLLQKEGHQVHVAGNGAQAVGAYLAEQFDLVLMDVQMPDMDGLEATAAIRAAERAGHPRIPILAMTAHAMNGDRERCLAAGMDGYLSKPVLRADLLEAIANLCELPCTSADPVELVKPTVEPFDRQEALRLAGDDPELLSNLSTVFTEQAAPIMAEIQDAAARKDLGNIRRAAHKLQGSLSVFCATSAAETLKHVQQIAKTGDLDGLDEAVATLGRELSHLTAALAQLPKGRDNEGVGR